MNYFVSARNREREAGSFRGTRDTKSTRPSCQSTGESVVAVFRVHHFKRRGGLQSNHPRTGRER